MRNLIQSYTYIGLAVLLLTSNIHIHGMNVAGPASQQAPAQSTQTLRESIKAVDQYLFLDTALFTIVDTAFEDFSKMIFQSSVTPLDLISSIRITHLIEKLMNIDAKNYKKHIDINALEESLKRLIKDYIDLQLSLEEYAVQHVAEVLSPRLTRMFNDLSVNQNISEQNKRLATERIFELLSRAVAYNVTNESLLAEEIQKAVAPFSVTISVHQIKQKLPLKYVQILRKNVVEDNQDYSRSITEICIEFTKQIGDNILKDDDVKKYINVQNLASNTAQYMQPVAGYQPKKIINTAQLEHDLGLQPGLLEPLSRNSLHPMSYVPMLAEGTVPELFSDKGPAHLQGVALGTLGTLGAWFIGHAACNSCMEAAESTYATLITPLAVPYLAYQMYANSDQAKKDKIRLGFGITAFAAAQYSAPEVMHYVNGTAASLVFGYHALKQIATLPNRITDVQKYAQRALLFSLLNPLAPKNRDIATQPAQQ